MVTSTYNFVGPTQATRSAPETKKHSWDGENGMLFYGCCEMQGWRSTMEDAIISEPYLRLPVYNPKKEKDKK